MFDRRQRRRRKQRPGEIVKSMRLSEARLLLSRYKKIGLQDLPAGSGTERAAAGGESAEGKDETAGGVPEQGLMKLIEKAVMALTKVGLAS